jgi:hypothetical protein
MIYVVHHAVTLLLAAAAALALPRGRWPLRAPRLALLLWHATAVSAVTGAVGLLLSVGLAPYHRGIAPALGALFTEDATPLSSGHVAAVAAGLLLAAATVGVQAHSSWQLWRQRSRHRLLLRLVGRPDPHGRALLLDHPAAAAYYVPGSAGCVVVSTGAVDALTERELAAVLAHDPLGPSVTDPSRYSVTFLPALPDPDRVAALPPPDGGEYALHGRELYLWLPDGMARSPMGTWPWDRLLGVAGTNRNWNTVRKLVELGA